MPSYCTPSAMRVLGVDFGRRRIGLALSDASATLARPWQTVAARPLPARPRWRSARPGRGGQRRRTRATASTPSSSACPRRLGGEDNDQTRAGAGVCRGAAGTLTGLPVALQDERLSSRAAEQALAVHERDWRKRKAKLDAAAAAVILQDYLDQRAREAMKT